MRNRRKEILKKNVVISGFGFDALKDGESVLSAVTGLIQAMDDNIKLTDCKRLKNKATNQWINKVIVSFNSVLIEIKLLINLKSSLKVLLSILI